jgi:hypothetical protein
VYVVDNVRQADPERFGLVDLYGETLARLVQRAREQHHYTVPLPVRVYDDNRQVPAATGTPDAPPVPVVRQQGTDPDLVAMTRTSAILNVLASHTGPMRPIEVWTELRRLGRNNDPKGDVSTTMFDLWKAGRIGKAARGHYYGLSRDQPPTPPPTVTAVRERPRPTPTTALPRPVPEAAEGPSDVSDGGPKARRSEGDEHRRRTRGLRGMIRRDKR